VGSLSYKIIREDPFCFGLFMLEFYERSFILSELNTLEDRLYTYLNPLNPYVEKKVRYVLSTGGKRIRPLISLLCGRLINCQNDLRYLVACVCEYIHASSLLHDDVIDNAPLRRAKPTVHTIWGRESAILLGDFIYSTACQLMVQTKNLTLIEEFAACIKTMSHSELFQLECNWNDQLTKEDY
jgi:octaprenyl-diphosphate synthase